MNGLHTILVVAVIQTVAFAECPIPEDGTLFVRVERGHLIIDTWGSTRVEVEVSNPRVQIEEECFEDHAEVGGVVPERVYGPLDWRIRVPDSINLDLLTFAGSIRIANTTGNVTARTTGGSVISGNIGGDAAMITQGGSILSGHIGGNAELRSTGGGQVEIGDVGGNAELETIAGPITVGRVQGRVHAETAGGMIKIGESIGQLEAVTLAGDIVVGTSAGLTSVETAGGNIRVELVRGPFIGATDLGNILITRAESFVEARTGAGDIEVHLVPLSLDGDLHVTLTTNSGNIWLRIPEDLPAEVEANVQRTVLSEPNIRSEFPMETVGARPNLPAGPGRSFSTSTSLRRRARLNGGGNSIQLETSRGSIEIRH